jgi:hypothetical protein
VSRDVYGAPWDGLGCEHAHLAAGPEGARVDGLVLLRRDGVAIRRLGLAGGFSAELRVDSDGLAIDYPETFRRIWPT